MKNYPPPVLRDELYAPADDSNDPERRIHHIIHKQGIFIRTEIKINEKGDEEAFGPYHTDLKSGGVYVSAIEVISNKESLDRTFVERIARYCPMLRYTESLGKCTLFRFVHPKFLGE